MHYAFSYHIVVFSLQYLKINQTSPSSVSKNNYFLQVLKASAFPPTTAASYFFIPVILLNQMVEQPFYIMFSCTTAISCTISNTDCTRPICGRKN